MSGWDELAAELDRCAATGRVVDLWWRDDDATGPHPALDRLLDLTATHKVPVALAVIPERATDIPGAACVLQHGWAHADHARPGEKKIELGGGNPHEAVRRDLGRGRQRLAELFGPRFLPVLVPPWNRIDPALRADLPRLGYRALSAFNGGGDIDCHIDPIDWRDSRGFAGDPVVLSSLLGRLRLGEPTGLLTHHRQHDEATWRFLAALLQCTTAHPAARWRGLADLLS